MSTQMILVSQYPARAPFYTHDGRSAYYHWRSTDPVPCITGLLPFRHRFITTLHCKAAIPAQHTSGNNRPLLLIDATSLLQTTTVLILPPFAKCQWSEKRDWRSPTLRLQQSVAEFFRTATKKKVLYHQTNPAWKHHFVDPGNVMAGHLAGSGYPGQVTSSIQETWMCDWAQFRGTCFRKTTLNTNTWAEY